jgi:hypothetical protein
VAQCVQGKSSKSFPESVFSEGGSDLARFERAIPSCAVLWLDDGGQAAFDNFG